jgi:hypothetical protein
VQVRTNAEGIAPAMVLGQKRDTNNQVVVLAWLSGSPLNCMQAARPPSLMKISGKKTAVRLTALLPESAVDFMLNGIAHQTFNSSYPGRA